MALSVFTISKGYIKPGNEWKTASYLICAGCIGVSIKLAALLMFP